MVKKVVSESMKVGVYANAASVAHDGSGEFTLDFMKMVPMQAEGDGPEAHVVARVTMSLVTLKNIVRAMEENSAKYEQKIAVVTTQDALRS